MGIFNRKKEQRSEPVDAVIHSPLNTNTGLSFKQIIGSQTNALALSTVFRCIQIISDSLAVLPVGVYTLDGKRQPHTLDGVWRDRDNIYSKYELLKNIVQSVLLKGNGFFYLHRNQDGSVKKIQWLEAEDVTIIYNNFTGNRQVLYYLAPLLTDKKIEPVNMIHVRMFSHDGVNGISVLNVGNRSFRLGNTLENNAYNFFGNGCNLSGVLSVASSLTPQQIKDIHKAWDESYVNGSGIAVLQGNMQYQSVSNTAKENELLESREFTVTEICRWFGINPILLGVNSGANYASLEQAQNDFVVHTLLPWVECLEEEFSRKMLKPSEQANLEVVLDENYLLRMDKKN